MSSLDTAVATYIELLGSGYFESTHETLARAAREQNLVWLGRPLCTVLRPCFLPDATLRFAQRGATLVARGLNTISRELLRSPDLRRYIALTEVEEAAVRCDPGPPSEIVGRLDGFISPEGTLKFIEYNPDPGAVANYYELSRIFGALPVMRQFGRRYRVRSTTTRSSLVWLLARLAARLLTGGGLTVIWSGGEAQDALSKQLELEVRAARRVVRRLGLRMEVARLEELSFHRDDVFHAGRRVTVAYVTDWEGLLRAFSFGHPFWRATRLGHLSVVNSWASKVLRANKAVFGLLSDSRFRHLFPDDVAEALAAHIPWTRLVQEGWTTRHGETIDLLPFVSKNRERLVIKPVAAQGGKGVTLGWSSDDSTWRAAVGHAVASPHVVQERVDGRHEPYPTSVDGRLAVRDYATDFNVFVWNTNTVRGYMARVSDGALMNVTGGAGTLAPVCSIRVPA